MLPGVGVFGSGQLISFLVPCLRQEGFNVTALWSFNMELAQEAAERLNIPTFTDSVDKVLLDKMVQFVCVACPPHMHPDIVSKALAIGKHVLCDWPAALTTPDIIKMVERSTYYPLISIVCHPLRFLPGFQMMRKLINEGYVGRRLTLIQIHLSGSSLLDLGDRYSVKCDEFMGGGLLTQVGSHIIDIVSFVTGVRAVRVHGMLRTLNQTKAADTIRRVTVDDFCCFQMELENKIKELANSPTLVTVTINCNPSLGPFHHEVVIFGTSGYLTLRGSDLYGKTSSSISTESKLDDMDSDISRSPKKPAITEDLIYVDNEDLSYKCESNLPEPYQRGLIRMVGSLRKAFSLDDRVSLNAQDDSEKTNKENANLTSHWDKSAVKFAANFEDGEYIQAITDAIRLSSENKEWVRVSFRKMKTEASVNGRANGY